MANPPTGGPTGVTLIDEQFNSADGAPWPAPWVVAGGVAHADVNGGRGRFAPSLSSYSLARMAHPAPTGDTRYVNVEALYTISFADVSTSGAGFYVRHDGGYVFQPPPAPQGLGYCAFVAGFRNQLELWFETAGQEQQLLTVPVPLASQTPYRVRFRVTQSSSNTTHLAAKIWPASGAEPSAWMIQIDDHQPLLQNLVGGIATDGWSNFTSGSATPAADVFFADINLKNVQ